MTLSGPRPEANISVKCWKKKIPYFNLPHSLRPPVLDGLGQGRFSVTQCQPSDAKGNLELSDL